RWRTVAPSGPAGTSRSTRPRSTATRTPSAVRGLETLARSQTRRGSPWVCRVRCASDTPSAWAKSTSTGISGALSVSTPSIWHTGPAPEGPAPRLPRAGLTARRAGLFTSPARIPRRLPAGRCRYRGAPAIRSGAGSPVVRRPVAQHTGGVDRRPARICQPQRERRTTVGILDRIERGLDRGVTRVFSPGRGQLKPLDLAQGLKRECDDQIQVLDRTRTLAPNVFSIYLHSQDYDRFSSWQDTLLDELQRVLMEHAEKQRYMFV